MRYLNLYELEIEVDYDYEPATIGTIFSMTGECEILPSSLTIKSVICNGVEIIKIIPPEQLEEMEEQLIRELDCRN